MSDGTTIAGVSVATIAFVISLICLVWIVLHINVLRGGPGSEQLQKTKIFSGSEYF